MKHAIFAACAVSALALVAGPPNLVANGDFRNVEAGRPVSWETSGDSGRVSQDLTVVTEDGRSCARLRCTRIEGEGGAVHAMLAQVGVVELQEGALYTFSCRARHEGIRGSSVSVAISDMSVWANCGLEKGLGLDRSWREFRFVFRATRTVGKSSRLQFWFAETGTLCVADVRIEPAQEQRVEFTEVVSEPTGRNLVPNGSFALGGAGWSTQGLQAGWGNMARLHGLVVTGGPPTRPEFLRIPMGDGRTPVLGFDYFQPVMRMQTRALAANRRWIPVSTDAEYTLSADMRASVEGTRAWMGYTALDPDGARWNARQDGRQITLTSQWRRFTFTFRPPRRYLFVMLGPDLERDRRVDVDVDNVMLNAGSVAAPYEPRAPIEVAVEPPAGGVTVAGRKAEMVVRVANASPPPFPRPIRGREGWGSVTVHLRARDYFDRAAPLPPAVVSVPATGTAVRRVAVPASWRGWYGIQVTTDGASVVTTDIRLSIVPTPTVTSRGSGEGRVGAPTVLGMNHAFPDPWLIPLARMAGIGEYRDWSLKWEHIEPRPGEFRWDIADAQIDRVLRAGAGVMALLPPFPSAEWSSEAPASLRKPGYPGERIRQAYAPTDPAQLAAFASRAVSRYKDRVRVWEFLNEPIYTDYSLPRERYGPVDYVRLLRPVAAAIRAEYPRARIMGGAGAGAGGVTRDLIEAGLLDHIDILNLHMYPGLRAPEGYIAEMDRLLAEMDRRGKRKPIWITEFSYYGADNLPRTPFMPDSGDWAEERLVQDERQCADYTIRYCAIMLARGCEKVFLHSGSSGSVNMPSFECCLFDYGGAPRKVAPALANLAAMLGPKPRSVPVGKLPEGVYASAFETATRSVVVVWTTGLGGRLRVPAGTRCTDIVGNPLTGAVALSGSPVYLTGPAGQVRRLIAAIGR